MTLAIPANRFLVAGETAELPANAGPFARLPSVQATHIQVNYMQVRDRDIGANDVRRILLNVRQQRLGMNVKLGFGLRKETRHPDRFWSALRWGVPPRDRDKDWADTG